MGGNDYEVPPLTIGQLRRLKAQREALVSGDEERIWQAACEVVKEALSRNYPGTTVEQVGELLDMGNYARVLAAIMAKSGLEPGEAEAGPAPAEEDA